MHWPAAAAVTAALCTATPELNELLVQPGTQNHFGALSLCLLASLRAGTSSGAWCSAWTIRYSLLCISNSRLMVLSLANPRLSSTTKASSCSLLCAITWQWISHTWCTQTCMHVNVSVPHLHSPCWAGSIDTPSLCFTAPAAVGLAITFLLPWFDHLPLCFAETDS